MSIKFDGELVKQTYDGLSNNLKELEEKKASALVMNTPVGYMIAESLDVQIMKQREKLENVKYALDYMT